jgi:two-component system OmpR family sensor kinase
MDGFKIKLNQSIRLRLSLWLSLVIVAVALAAGAVSYRLAYEEAEALQDETLRQVAAVFDAGPPIAPPLRHAYTNGEAEDARVAVQDLSITVPPAEDPDAGPALPLPQPLSDGLHTITLRTETFRVLVLTTRSGRRLAVSQETELRDDIAQSGALRTVTPLLILVPILLLAVAHITRTLFHPVQALAKDIDSRPSEALHPVADETVPLEVGPFVNAINRLLHRVDTSVQTQRAFVRDAAHELRSPLAALSLQAERLSQADMSAAAQDRLQTLRRGIDRGRLLLDQLLSLARAQASSDPPVPRSVRETYRQVLEDLMPLAHEKSIDIGMEGSGDATIAATGTDLSTLIKNLLDNALRYTPQGGRIDLSVTRTETTATLSIADTGPGIPPEERDRVFDPFYRIPGQDTIGSGLGLSIVKTIAGRINASISLRDTDPGTRTGLTVTITVPVSNPLPTKSHPRAPDTPAPSGTPMY